MFDRFVTKKTPGQFRIRAIQESVHRGLHAPYKQRGYQQHYCERQSDRESFRGR